MAEGAGSVPVGGDWVNVKTDSGIRPQDQMPQLFKMK
jgi:hypothetical protein